MFQIPLLVMNIQEPNNNANNLSLLKGNVRKKYKQSVNKFNVKIKRFQSAWLIIKINNNIVNK